MIALFLANQWQALLLVGLVAFAVAFPAISVPVLRWLVRTEAGRAVCLIAGVALAVWWFSGHRFAAGRAAERAVWQARMVEQAMEASRQTIAAEDVSAKASRDARASGDRRADKINDSRRRAEGIAREPRTPGADGCPPVADPRLVRESREAADRIATAEDRLRGL